MTSITGSCLCGAHTVTISGVEKATPALCHCTSCRKASGSLFCYVFLIPADAYTLTSKDGKAPKVFHDKTYDTGNTLVRTFCEDCGSPVRSWIQGKEEQVVVRGGLFEPGVLPKPAVELYVKNNEEWESKVDGATHFEGMF